MAESKYESIAGNDDMSFHVSRKERYRDGPPATVFHHLKKELDNRARYAMAFIERWAMIAGEPDGEDTAGRQKTRRMTPEEISTHACECVKAAYKEFEDRGWIVGIPDFQQLADVVKQQENDND